MRSHIIDNHETRQIKDIDLYQQYLFVLYDKNEVAVFNTVKNEMVFKAKYQDATDTITRLFYVSNFDELSDDEEQQQTKNYFQGNFILIETKTIKPAEGTSEKDGLFRRINLVEVVNTEKLGLNK